MWREGRGTPGMKRSGTKASGWSHNFGFRCSSQGATMMTSPPATFRPAISSGPSASRDRIGTGGYSRMVSSTTARAKGSAGRSARVAARPASSVSSSAHNRAALVAS